VTLLRQSIPKLTLCAVESGSGCLLEKRDLAVQTWSDLHGGVFAHCYTQDDTDWIELPGLAEYGFSKTQEEVKAFFHPKVPDELVRETYRRSVLPMVLQASGTEVLHSSAVLMPQGVVALCGKSWSGKSTTAYALSQRGYSLWADDAVAFDTTAEQVLTTRLPFRIQLRPASRSFFGTPCLTTNPATGTRAANDRPGQQPAALSALCILKPLTSNEDLEVEIRPLSASEAFPAILSHAYCFSLHDRERKRQMMQRYMDLTTRVPVIEIRYKPNLERITGLVDCIESCANTL